MKIKKIFAIMAAAACMAGSLCSCDSEPAHSEPKEEYSRISVSPLDEQLVGEWFNGANGYRFGENRKLSLIIDFSERAHFMSDGSFYTLNAIMPPEDVTNDGTVVQIYSTGWDFDTDEEYKEVILELTRTGTADASTFDGDYTITGGGVSTAIANELGMEESSLTMNAKVEGESLIVTVVDCMDYEIMGDGSLDIFSSALSYVDENARGLNYKYTIEGDTLTMNYTAIPDSPAEVYTRAK